MKTTVQSPSPNNDELENQLNFRQIVNNIGGTFWLLSADLSKILYISNNYKELFGSPHLSGRPPREALNSIIHPDDREHISHQFSIFLNTGKFTEEFRIIRPDGEIRWISSSAFHVYNDQNQLIKHAGLILDITDRKSAELSDKEKSDRLRAIIMAMPDIIITYNRNGEYLDLSTSHETNRIFKHQDVVGKHIGDFFSSETTELFMSSIQKSIDNQQLQTVTFEIFRDGKIRYFENRFLPIDSERVLSVIREITESKLKDEKLKFQSQLQELLTKISNSFINLPADCLYSTLNQSVHELGEFVGADRFYIYEYRPGEELYYNTIEWCSDGIEPLKNKMQKVSFSKLGNWLLEHRQVDYYVVEDVENLTDNDELKPFLQSQGIKSIIQVPLIDHGNYSGFMGIDAVRSPKQFDVEEKQLLKIFAQTVVSAQQRIQSELALAKALEDASESDRLKSAFLATISHELRTPLNHILGFGALIRDHSTEKHIREYATELCSSGNGLLGMIEDMFTLALAEKSTMIVRTSQVKGVELYMASKELLTEMLNISGKNELIKLQFKPDHALMSTTFIADRQKIQQVLSNLFNNAVKFTNTGTIEFGITRTRDCLKMYVSDTGIGIPVNQQQHIFDLFRQLDDGINRHYGGLGIGLSMSKKLAEVLGGHLNVESEPGKGSCFYFSVPVQFI